jgi:bla regulator protein BlaR1
MIAEIVNHLWQSTAFSLAVGVLAVACRRNQARVRYSLWLAASLKFLVPFTVLITLGGQLEVGLVQRSTAPAVVASTVLRISEPFAETDAVARISLAGAQTTSWLTLVLLSVWACGLVAITLSRLQAWRRLRAAVRVSSAWNGAPTVPAGIELRAAPGLLEPGVVGVWRPTILVPDQLERHLTPEQIRAVLAHEICHVRRRDNLTATLHMAVEALFWFHPLVWWIGARLVDERERACDEQVLREIAEPLAYAEGIVTVCKRYVEAPLMNVAGVGGSNMKARIEAILAHSIGSRLTVSKRIALTVAAMAAVVIPIAIGTLTESTLASQQSTDASLSFSAATIKPTPREAQGDFEPSIVMFMPDGSFRRTNSTLRTLVRTAYGIHPYQVIGGPDWADDDRFDIEAKSDAPATRDETLQKLRTLLAERFTLQVRRTTSDDAVYHLVVSNSGSKMQPAAESTSANVRIGSYSGHRRSAQLADYLGSIVGRPVVNRTGLEGIFNIELKFSPDPNDPGGVSVFTAVREQLGLQLVPARGPVETLEIVAARKPIEN